MGDLCDVFDLERFMRSEEGRKHLDEIIEKLKGKTIVDVSFSNEVHSVMTVLHLSDGSTLEVFQADHDVGVLRETFAAAIEEEYFKDYPERRRGT